MRTSAFLPVLFFTFLISEKTEAQTTPVKHWDKVFGGERFERLKSMVPAGDGNYLLAGHSSSSVSGDKTEPPRNFAPLINYPDYWVVKMSANGTKIWDRTFGGGNLDQLESIVAAPDGGFLLAGSSPSGISAEKTDSCRGGYDYWVVKIDAAGNKLWDKTFGGEADDFAAAAISTPDGGFLLGGYSSSGISGDKTSANRSFRDYWVVKIDSAGNQAWDRTFGGNSHDYLKSLVATTDGGYLLCGYSNSPVSLDKTSATNGNDDFWVVKTDASGNFQWDKSFGGYGTEELYAALKTADGSYLLAGLSASAPTGNKTAPAKGSYDFWLAKIDGSGTKLWDRSFGGNMDDMLSSVILTADGGFLLGGTSRSGVTSDHSQPNMGYEDYWVVKTDASGIQQWDKNFGGNSNDMLTCLAATPDEGFLLGGWSYSPISGDKTVSPQGDADFWLIKLGFPNSITTSSASTELCAGSSAGISYIATGYYAVDNVFTVQLSDVSGSFDPPLNIGTATSSALSGAIQATIPAGIAAGNGYRIRVIASNTSTIGTDNGTNLVIKASPSVLINDTAICQAGNLLLEAPAIAGAGYTWTGPNGFTASSASISIGNVTNLHGGTYTLTVTANGCSTAKQVNVAIHPLPPATTGNDQTICSGSTITIGAAPVSGNSYSWSSNPAGFNSAAANPQVNPVETTSYTLTETTAAGCSKTSSLAITVIPLPATPTISATGNMLSSSAASGNQWFLNGSAIAGATGQSHTAQAPGDYSVQVTQNGCTSRSAAFNFVVTALVNPQAWNGEVKVYPNPVRTTLFIKNDKGRQLQWELLDVSGRKVAEGLFGSHSGTIDVGRLAGGVYQLLITDVRSKETIRVKISKQL